MPAKKRNTPTQIETDIAAAETTAAPQTWAREVDLSIETPIEGEVKFVAYRLSGGERDQLHADIRAALQERIEQEAAGEPLPDVSVDVSMAGRWIKSVRGEKLDVNVVPADVLTGCINEAERFFSRTQPAEQNSPNRAARRAQGRARQ